MNFVKENFFSCLFFSPSRHTHTEKRTELVLLGPLSDWSALRLEAGLAAVGVSQNQTPRSSRVHSLRICRVELIDARCFFIWKRIYRLLFFSTRCVCTASCWACSHQVRGPGKLFFLAADDLSELCFLCTPPLRTTTMDLVWIVGFVGIVCAWFVSAERHSVYWNSTNPK